MYRFAEAKDIDFKCELSDIDIDSIYHHFMTCNDEICYVFDNENIYGIITIGDMYRYYTSGREKLNINQKFRYVSNEADDRAEEIFCKFSTVHELPVINNKQLLGVLRNGEVSERDWAERRKRLKREYMGELYWLKCEKERMLQSLSASIYVFDLNGDKKLKTVIGEDGQKFWEKKKARADGISGLTGMIEEERNAFWGACYTQEWFDAFCMELKNLSVTMKNGVCKIDNCSSVNFNFEDGYRNVPNATKKAMRKIWLFGPCTIAGRYVADKDTIANYLQLYLQDNGYDDFEVINCGVFGGELNAIGRAFTEKISADDIVILAFSDWNDVNQGILKRNAVYCGDLGDIYI